MQTAIECQQKDYYKHKFMKNNTKTL